MKILHIASECNGGVLSFIENLSLNISDDQITLLTFGSIDKISELAKNKIKIPNHHCNKDHPHTFCNQTIRKHS